jgi:phosphoesterase RecJ-like protein
VSAPPEVVDAIRAANTIVIGTHAPMDGDGMGCGLALMRALESMDKQVDFITEAYIPRAYSFLAGYDRIRRIGAGDALPACDLVLGLDAGEPSRLGRLASETPPGARLVNIDHHVSNDGYGDIAWVDARAAATGEQVFMLLEALGAPIDEHTALALLVSLVTDTGRFCYSSTTARTLAIASKLVHHGADPDRLQRRLFSAIPLATLKLQGRAVEKLTLAADGKLSLLVIPHDFGADFGAGEEELKDLVDLVISVDGAMVGALVRGLDDGTTKVSLRSKTDAANVAEFASGRGGGGHIRAAGFSAPTGPDETAAEMLADLSALAVGAAQ